MHKQVQAPLGEVAVSRAIYNVRDIDKDGLKDVLGMYISNSEGANFWLSVLTDLQNRGIQDILIASISIQFFGRFLIYRAGNAGTIHNPLYRSFSNIITVY